DGPYTITRAHPNTSTYTLNLPNSPNIFPTFHVSQLHRYTPNDPVLFPDHELPRPGPVSGKRYIVRWVGYSVDEDEWLLRHELEDCEAL
ncbi:hypothetical protein PAXRUDRAFT_90704, partial [Paxillus rubicundulus Ve08.2h10]